MAIKNLQFVVTVAVDVPDSWECPTEGTEAIQGDICAVLELNAAQHAMLLDAKSIASVAVEFETITD